MLTIEPLVIVRSRKNVERLNESKVLQLLNKQLRSSLHLKFSLQKLETNEVFM